MKKKKTKKNKSELDYIEEEERLENALDAILDLLESFSEKYLNEEYWELCHDMALEIYDLGAPLDKGKHESWASGIVHAIGMVNFLNDPSFAPYMELSQIANIFCISENTMLNKSKQICDELELIPMDPEWCLESFLEDNPFVRLFENFDGLIEDIGNDPHNVQEQAYKHGLIPLMPGDSPRQNIKKDNSGKKIKIIEFPSGKNKKAEIEQITEQKDKDSDLFGKLKD